WGEPGGGRKIGGFETFGVARFDRLGCWTLPSRQEHEGVPPMRKGFLWTICTTLAVAGGAHAQPWPWYPSAAARQGYPMAPTPLAGPAVPMMQGGYPYPMGGGNPLMGAGMVP